MGYQLLGLLSAQPTSRAGSDRAALPGPQPSSAPACRDRSSGDYANRRGLDGAQRAASARGANQSCSVPQRRDAPHAAIVDRRTSLLPFVRMFLNIARSATDNTDASVCDGRGTGRGVCNETRDRSRRVRHAGCGRRRAPHSECADGGLMTPGPGNTGRSVECADGRRRRRMACGERLA
jgi:hypothetical protein